MIMIATHEYARRTLYVLVRQYVVCKEELVYLLMVIAQRTQIFHYIEEEEKEKRGLIHKK